MRKKTLSAFAILLLLVSTASAQFLPDGRLEYGYENLPLPPMPRRNLVAKRSVELLGSAMLDPSYEVSQRVQFARDIGLTDHAESLQYLQQVMADSSHPPMLRAQAAWSAGVLGNPAAVQPLKALLSDSEPSIVLAAIEAGALLKDPAFVAAGLSHSAPEVLSTAMRNAIADHADQIAKLLPGLQQHQQVLAIDALGRIGASAHAGVVAAHLNGDVQLRAAAARALGAMKATSQSEPLIEKLKDPHPTVRREATTALLNVAPASVHQPRAIEMLSDPDPTVREAAARVIQASPTPAAIPILIKHLDDPYRRLWRAARSALVAIGVDSVPAAVRLLDSSNPRRQEDGSYILGELKNDASLQRHVQLLDAKDWALVAQVAYSLGRIGNTDVAEAVGKLAAGSTNMPTVATDEFNDQVNAYRNAIVAAVRLGYKPVVDATKGTIGERDKFPPPIRSAAFWAWGMMGDPAETSIANSAFSIYENVDESEDVKVEGLKALGNLRVASVVNQLASIDRDSGSNLFRWLAHWSKDRIEGKTTEYIPPEDPYVPSLSIEDISQN